MTATQTTAATTIRDVVVNGVRLHVRETGAGSDTVVFSHGLLRNARMFDAQVAALAGGHRCLAYDHRGQALSERPPVRLIDLETVYADAVALLEQLGAAPCHWVGLSMGGMVGMRIAARRPELLRSLVLLETTGEREPLLMALRARGLVLGIETFGPRLGARVVLDQTMRLFYGKTFRRDPARRAEYLAERESVRETIASNPIAAVRGVLGRRPVTAELGRIRAPTLVVVGDEDVPTPVAAGRRLAAAIPGARLEIVRGAGHTSTVEQPEALARLITAFLGA